MDLIDIEKITNISLSNPKIEPIVTFLGTGSALPSKYRNVTGILLTIPNIGNMLLDCGEGSYGQIFRAYGPQTANNILLNLKVVFISHIHADHHLGLIRILQKREILFKNEGKEPDSLIIVGPFSFGCWLEELKQILPINYQFIDAGSTLKNVNLLENLYIKTVPVIHCHLSYGIVVEMILDEGRPYKIVYSGDTIYCNELIEAGLGSDLVIHEATFEDNMQSEAKLKNHSTTFDAIEAFKRMGASYLMIFHFSQRYPRIPIFNENVNNVGVAFDLMKIRISELPIVPLLNPGLQIIFQDIEEEDEENSNEDSNTKPKKSKKKKQELIQPSKKKKNRIKQSIKQQMYFETKTEHLIFIKILLN